MIKNITRRALLQTGVGAAAVIAAPHIVRAQSYKAEYKMSVLNVRPSAYVDAAYIWTDLVRERTSGRINIKIYEGSQLVGGVVAKELPGLRQGILDMISLSTISGTPNVAKFNIFSLPFLMPNDKAWDAVVETVKPDLTAAVAEQGGTVVGWSQNGFRQLFNSVREIRKPDDLKGLKIRYAAPIYGDIFTALGANPVQMSWGDLQSALGTGAVDGMETPVELFLQAKLHTLGLDHGSVWNYATDANMFIVGNTTWNTFTPEDQAIVRKAAEEAAAGQTALHRKIMAETAYPELEKRGVQAAQLTPEELGAFRTATAGVRQKWSEVIGADLVARAEKAVAATM